jgi:hypothetical protein
MSQTSDRKILAVRTNSAAGLACSPASFTIRISCLIRLVIGSSKHQGKPDANDERSCSHNL